MQPIPRLLANLPVILVKILVNVLVKLTKLGCPARAPPPEGRDGIPTEDPKDGAHEPEGRGFSRRAEETRHRGLSISTEKYCGECNLFADVFGLSWDASSLVG